MHVDWALCRRTQGLPQQMITDGSASTGDASRGPRRSRPAKARARGDDARIGRRHFFHKKVCRSTVHAGILY